MISLTQFSVRLMSYACFVHISVTFVRSCLALSCQSNFPVPLSLIDDTHLFVSFSSQSVSCLTRISCTMSAAFMRPYLALSSHPNFPVPISLISDAYSFRSVFVSF